ncbi:transglycosylase SLT domain-containing protein [Paucibacter sp. R3-3]|uniref:Transglycosylase SLT domain-containing protein n=1 Tax=Roseateles agri TaxID=3098619 RepID=A0ABU5DLH3_9BURK|nr:transglycosylase SLT domain-containing protein [Paucibacter sp. R3-3]MDY0747157.1 transglycosylase SLT domain-containing protein [Paucibacter sp. R3-3]
MTIHHRWSALLLASLLAACATQPPASPASSDASPAPAGTAQVPPPTPVAAASSAPVLPPMPAPTLATEAAASALLEDTLRPGVKVDLSDTAIENADLWARLRAGFAMPELDNDGVRKAEAWYSSRPDYVQRMTERGSRYLFHIVEEVEKRGMPTEMALLPFIESAYNPQAQSTAKASGMWQFVPATGRDFALKQNIFRDDRRDVLASTRAALDYLNRLHDMFGDWQLALAAYNWGQGNVQKSIARNQKRGLPTDYDSIQMPDETRYYLPKLQAVKNIVMTPEAFGLTLPSLSNHPYFLSVAIERDMDVDVAARLAGLGTDEFKQFNPQMNKPVILAAGTERVLLPFDNASAFALNLAAHRGPLATWTAWVVPRTMKPAEAAKQVGMNEDALREVNHIPPKMLVKKGSTLLVPRAAHRQEDVSELLAENASMTLAPDVPPLRRVSWRAGKGETVAAVARRYRVSTAQVAQWNKLGPRATSFKTGQTVIVYTATPATPAVAPQRVAAKTVAAPAGKQPQRLVKTKSARGGHTVTSASAKPSTSVARR